MKKLVSLPSLLLVILLFSACDETSPEIEDSVPNPTTPTVSNTSNFSLNLFKSVISESQPNENVIISPLSVSSVVKMILAGSDGETKQEILDAYDKKTYQELLDDSKSYMNWLSTRQGQPTIEVSNALFYDENKITPLAAFKQDLKTYFDASEFQSDFSNSTQALSEINGWVNTKTQGRIEKILDDIRDDEAMFLLNALYLKADWKEGFDPQSTRMGDFKTADGQTVEVPFMFEDRGFLHFGNDKFDAISLPYKDEEIAVHFIKPAKGSLEELISDFSEEDLSAVQDSANDNRFMVFIPKFEIEYKNEQMAKALKNIGIEKAFSTQADLSNLAEESNTYISRVVHKTFLTIDEKGTEGAAVTAGGVSVTSLPPTIQFNEPFLIVLSDKSGNILFMGRISNPSN